jgi:hypothetical protein
MIGPSHAPASVPTNATSPPTAAYFIAVGRRRFVVGQFDDFERVLPTKMVGLCASPHSPFPGV